MEDFEQFPIQILTREGEQWINLPELVFFMRFSPDVDISLLADALEEMCFSRSGLDSGGEDGP